MLTFGRLWYYTPDGIIFPVTLPLRTNERVHGAKCLSNRGFIASRNALRLIGSSNLSAVAVLFFFIGGGDLELLQVFRLEDRFCELDAVRHG